MALAIVAIAFIALIGLLPAGMKVFEAAANTTAETRMVSHLSSLLQATDYSTFQGSYHGVTFYYDVDGGYLDSEQAPKTDKVASRVYAAKVLVDSQNVPSSSAGAGEKYDQLKTNSKVIIAMGRNDPVVLKMLSALASVNDVGVGTKVGTRIKIQPLLIARMDLEP
jgi:uncharacterized protein (TIGR02598 family)